MTSTTGSVVKEAGMAVAGLAVAVTMAAVRAGDALRC